MDNGFVIAAALFILCLAVRSIYEFLKEARKIDPENKVIFIAIFTSMCVLWVSWFSLCTMDPFRMEVPIWLGWVGLAIFIAGSILAVGALIQLRGVENIDHLVTAGLFRKLRHPMYAGFVCWVVGWSIYHGAFLSLAIGLVGIVSVLWWRHLEEGRLEKQFGADYHQYRLTTWF